MRTSGQISFEKTFKLYALPLGNDNLTFKDYLVEREFRVESLRGMRLLGMRRETRRKASLWSKTTTNSVMFQILFYKENQWPYFIF